MPKLNILLVDDSSAIIRRMQEMLEDVECINQIQMAFNGDDALQLVKANMPHVILLDINMPGKSGVDVLKEIKQLYPAIIVMMVTNQSTEYYKPLCKNLGADYFVDKSTEFEQIPDIIEGIYKQLFIG